MSGDASTFGANYVHQHWRILGGEIEFRIAKGKPFDEEEYAQLKDIVEAIERMASGLRPADRSL